MDKLKCPPAKLKPNATAIWAQLGKGASSIPKIRHQNREIKNHISSNLQPCLPFMTASQKDSSKKLNSHHKGSKTLFVNCLQKMHQTIMGTHKRITRLRKALALHPPLEAVIPHMKQKPRVWNPKNCVG